MLDRQLYIPASSLVAESNVIVDTPGVVSFDSILRYVGSSLAHVTGATAGLAFTLHEIDSSIPSVLSTSGSRVIIGWSDMVKDNSIIINHDKITVVA